jgi:DMSO/TMAO reductase YedYZ molybdopterin-dependent catalytic subunit/thiosulfate reductase cytochrome b subunit
VRVFRAHHLFVRWSHWLNIPVLLGLTLSGLSIYWTSPVYQHIPDPQTGNVDPVADLGVWIVAHVPGQHHYASPPDWAYNHVSLGPGMLALALRFHWFCAYLFMLNGLVYVFGLAIGGEWRSLLPRRTDLRDATRTFLYYVGLPFARLTRRSWLPSASRGRYNALQRNAYFVVSAAGLISVLTGWSIHKPMQLSWLAAMFGGYDKARVWHFWLMWVYACFVVPHVVLVLADGWDTVRSMIVGWSTRVQKWEGADARVKYPESAFQRVFQERPPQILEVAPAIVRHVTRRDVLILGAGSAAAIAVGGSLLPQSTLARLGIEGEMMRRSGREWLLNKALRLDDDVAEALYSNNRLVPTYTRSQITPLRNNYNGATPDPGYIPGWRLTLDGLASGLTVSLNIRDLMTGFHVHEQITRLVCVEGWSAIAGWAGLRFDELLRIYPPMAQAKWARIESAVNLDASGKRDPYYMSLDLATAHHPQTLLATHFNGQPLTVEHGAPVRLLVPVKLGLKNVKAITRITYSATRPADYWSERGYSYYDGI